MGRTENRKEAKKMKKQFKKQNMSDKNYEDFIKKLDERYYNDIIITAFEDVYNVFYKELRDAMKENRISDERANKILNEAMVRTKKYNFEYKGRK